MLSTMIPISIHIKQVLAKMILPCLFILSCLIMLLGQAQPKLIEVVRLKVTDFLAPGYALIEKPFGVFESFLNSVKNIRNIAAENNSLRAENTQLKRWYYVAMGLAEENIALKNQLHWSPDPNLSFVTARVVADVSGVYHKAILVVLGGNNHVHSGEVALNSFGLVGRVTEVGERSARILLINDSSSRIPVNLMSSHAHAIMAGDNSLYPRLIFYPEDKHPIEGEKVVTDSQGGALPDGIPIGNVHYLAPGQPVIVPYMSLDRLKIIRIVDYGMSAILPPDVCGRMTVPKKKLRLGPVANTNMLGHQ